MDVRRPCTSCGRDEPPEATTCSSCGAALTAWSSAAAPGPVRGEVLGPSTRRLLAVVAVLAVGGAAWWLLARSGTTVASPSGPTWRVPESVAAWAGKELQRLGVPADEVRAAVETRTRDERRVLVTSHPAAQPLDEVVRSAAELLLEARDEGERLRTHLAVVRHGSGLELVSLAIPVALAAHLVADGDYRTRFAAAAGPPPAPPVEPAPEPEPPPAEPVPEPRPPAPPEPTPEPVEPEPAGEEPAPDVVEDEPPEPEVQPEPVAEELRPVNVIPAPGPSVPRRIQPGQENAVFQKIQLHPAGRRALRLERLAVSAKGTLDDALAVSFVTLLEDVDRNGRRTDPDRIISDLGSFSDDDGIAAFEGLDVVFGADGQPINLLVLLDFDDPIQAGRIMVNLEHDAIEISEVDSGRLVPLTGLPRYGRMVAVEGNLERDTLQERLDELATRGPDATLDDVP